MLLALILLSFLIRSVIAIVDGQYDFSTDFDRCVGTVDSLVTGSDTNGGDCQMYQGFLNLSITCSPQLTATQNVDLQALVAQVKVALATTGLTDDQRVFKVGALVDTFKQQHSDIYDIIKYQNISDWSALAMLPNVIITKQQALIQNSIALTSNGSCPYFDALRAAAAATGDSSCISAVDNLINNNLMAYACDIDIKLTGKIVVINQKVTALFATCPALQTQLQNFDIPGFGSFSQFSDSAATYSQFYMPQTLADTGTFPNIPVIDYLQAALNDWITKDLNMAILLNSFISRVNQTFENVTDPVQRQQFLADYTFEIMVFHYDFTSTCLFDVSFGTFGTLWDHIFLSIFTPVTQVGPVPPCPSPTTSSLSTTTPQMSTTTTTVTLSTAAPTWTACSCTCP